MSCQGRRYAWWGDVWGRVAVVEGRFVPSVQPGCGGNFDGGKWWVLEVQAVGPRALCDSIHDSWVELRDSMGEVGGVKVFSLAMFEGVEGFPKMYFVNNSFVNTSLYLAMI